MKRTDARSKVARSAGIALCIFALGAAKRDVVTPFPPGAPHRAPWELNRDLLLPVNDRITFLVDVPRGAEPKVEALDHVVRLAAKYGGRKANWRRLDDFVGTRVRWENKRDDSPSADDARAAASQPERSPDAEDTRRIRRQVLQCEGGELPLHTTFVFIRYIGRYGVYGEMERVTSEISCGGREFVVLFMAQTLIARDRAPGISQVFLETRALAHEYGHALGVGSNPEHGWWMRIKSYPYRAGPHCVNRECAVSVPTARALLDGKMRDYCDECLRDIEHARDHWLHGTTYPESARLPQPDAEKEVARLKAYQFREGGESARLLSFGKSALPPLMKRMETLQGGDPTSPREQAALLVVKIIAVEDAERREVEVPSLNHLQARRQLSDVLLGWWEQERHEFMAGNDWELPALRPAE